MRAFLKRHPRLFDAAKAIARRCGRRPALTRFLEDVLPRHEAVTFLQAGAHDGITNDPYREFILRSNFSGVLVEPVPHTFQKLQVAYAHKAGVFFEACLLAYPPGEQLDFYTFAPAYLATRPDADQLSMLASFSRDQLVQAVAHDPASLRHIVNTPRRGRTVEQLMIANGLAGIDCLLLDVEGYEPAVLLALDYALVRPKLIAFESLHLGEHRDRVRAHLEQQGFRLFEFDQEIIALARPWQRRVRA